MRNDCSWIARLQNGKIYGRKTLVTRRIRRLTLLVYSIIKSLSGVTNGVKIKFKTSEYNLPTKFSNTELFPALWPPTTAICGRSKLQLWPMELKASWSLLMRGMSSSIPRFPMVGSPPSPCPLRITAEDTLFQQTKSSQVAPQPAASAFISAEHKADKSPKCKRRPELWRGNKRDGRTIKVATLDENFCHHPVRRHPASAGGRSSALLCHWSAGTSVRVQYMSHFYNNSICNQLLSNYCLFSPLTPL